MHSQPQPIKITFTVPPEMARILTELVSAPARQQRHLAEVLIAEAMQLNQVAEKCREATAPNNLDNPQQLASVLEQQSEWLTHLARWLWNVSQGSNVAAEDYQNSAPIPLAVNVQRELDRGQAAGATRDGDQ